MVDERHDNSEVFKSLIDGKAETVVIDGTKYAYTSDKKTLVPKYGMIANKADIGKGEKGLEALNKLPWGTYVKAVKLLNGVN